MLKLPNLENAFVAEPKIVDYLLNLGSENGRAKARFFLSFGFTVGTWEVMAEALRLHSREHEVSRVEERPPFGVLYVIEGDLKTPDGRNPSVRFVWVIDAEDSVPRLVSAYPIRGESILEELERVALTADLPEHGLEAGDIGMVVHIYGERQGYEVEFVTVNGNLITLASVYPAQIRQLEPDEIASARRVGST